MKNREKNLKRVATKTTETSHRMIRSNDLVAFKTFKRYAQQLRCAAGKTEQSQVPRSRFGCVATFDLPDIKIVYIKSSPRLPWHIFPKKSCFASQICRKMDAMVIVVILPKSFLFAKIAQ